MSSQTNERAFESLIEKALDIKENGGALVRMSLYFVQVR